jgi:hypothetical protein
MQVQATDVVQQQAGAVALRAPLSLSVRQLTPTTSMAGAEFQQLMMFPLQDRPMVLMPY